MFSWLNFEELLIHNPIELINPSKDTISVAMNKKQYIEFFSNKHTYNGVYYDEAMDFCLFYFADPLQSYKEGDVYAQGYIDVEMKIYRVKWLCNVSIKLPLVPETTGNLLDVKDGANISVDNLKIELNGVEKKHIAYAYSSDGVDRFSTIYPRFNLLEGTKDFSGYWYGESWGWEVDGTFKGLTVKKRRHQWGGLYKVFTAPKNGVYTFSAYIKSSGDNANITRYTYKNNDYFGGQWIGNNFDWFRDSYTVTLKAGDTFIVRYEITGIGSDTILWTAGHKWEYGSTATPYMPSESETTKSDRPSYIGQYTDYTLEDSTNPSSYTWREIQEDKLNVSKTEMVVNAKNKTITTVLNGALAKCTKDKDITGWRNSQPNANYNYRQPQYTLDIGADDFIISGYGLRGLKNG